MTDKKAKLPVSLRVLRRLDFPGKLGVLGRFYGEKLAREGVCWVKTYSGVEWLLDLANSTHRWLVYGDYEGPALRRWALRSLRSPRTLVLAGGNVGQMVASLQPHLRFEKIHAFEPDTEAADWFSASLARNSGMPVILNRCGLGQRSETKSFVHSGWRYTHGSQSFISETEGEPVQLVSLDEYWDELWGKIDLWILDVEGYELYALKGAKKLFSQHTVRALYMEVDTSPNSLEALQFVKSYGYSTYELTNSGLLRPCNRPDRHSNVLLLPR